MADEEESDNKTSAEEYLKRISRDIKTILGLVSKACGAMVEAESEVPEMMRRFANYFHDVVHIMDCYKTLGLPVPKYLNDEIQRCDDRMRQVLGKLHTDGGTFEKVRREMAADPENKWDHTRQLSAPKGDPQ